MKHPTPKITFVYDRYKRATPKRKATVEIRVSYDKRQKYISTGIQLYPREWKNGEVVNTPEAQQLNQQIGKMLVNVRQIVIDMEEEGRIDIFSIPERLKRKAKGLPSFYDFARQRADIRKYGKTKNTQYKYEKFLKSLNEYGLIKYFDDITEENILAFDEYLTGKGLKACSKWHNYHKYLNAFINDAVEKEYIAKNPYKTLSIDKGDNTDSLSRCLVLDELSKIMRAKMPTECLEKVRDVFVFQTYTCLSYADLEEFDYSKVVMVKGMKVYTGKRDKTGKRFTIPLLPPALKVLKKYGKLPVISNQKYNQYLKVVAQAARIDKPISTHWARHTGATLLLNAGVPMQIVSKICGHSSTKITEQIYAKLLDETVVEAIKKLQDKKL